MTNEELDSLRQIISQISAENLSLKRQLMERDNSIVRQLISYLKEFEYD